MVLTLRQLCRHPICIGIAGDSGSGKDTLATALTSLFGVRNVTHISGDNYHKWDRFDPMWQKMTHLNPRANNFHTLVRDVLALLDGKVIHRQHYDHRIGRFTEAKSLHKSPIIIVSGLHILYIPQLRKKIDVKFFLEMDENLRCFLKMKRDVHKRGYTKENIEESFKKRAADADRYIKPQAHEADIIFSTLPVNHYTLDETLNQERFKLKVILKNGIHYEEIVTVLTGICGFYVDTKHSETSGVVEMTIEGEAGAQDIELAAKQVISNMGELMTLDMKWSSGIIGVMQLISLSQISESLHERLAQW